MMGDTINTLTELIKKNEDVNPICSSIANDLKTEKLSLLELIENMENLLIRSDIPLRRGGTEALSAILNEIPKNTLGFNETKLLVEFYCDRLLDHHSIIPAILTGFLALLKMEQLPDGMVAKIFTSMNLHFVCQSQTQPDRFTCYQVYNEMMLKNPTELQALGPDFVCGYLQTIDSERDPRNLLYLFKNLPNFFQHFPPGHLVEDAFEAAACYFPVDFRTNPNDPRGITREDLSGSLLPCLTAIDEFIPFIVELALEKLSSDLKLAKLDSLVLLEKCFKIFSSEKLATHLTEIVSAILTELKPGMSVDENVQELAVQVLATIIKSLSDSEKIEDYTKVLDYIFAGTQHFLNDIHLNLFLPAIKFITTLSYSCGGASQFFIKKVIPKLLPTNEPSISDYITIMYSLKLLLEPCISFELNCKDELQNAWCKVTELFLKNTESENTELKIAAIENCSAIVKLLSREERNSLYTRLLQNVLSEKNELTKQKYMSCLKKITKSYPEEIQNMLTLEFVHLEGSSNSTLKRENIFQCICTLAPVGGFLTFLDKAIDVYISKDSFQFANFAVKSLRDLLIVEKHNEKFLNDLHHQINLTKRLIDWWHNGCNPIEHDISEPFDNEEVAKNLQFIISLIMMKLEEKDQKEIAVPYVQFTLDYSTRFMNSFSYLNDKDDLSTPEVHCSLSIITFESIVNGLLPQVVEESLSNCLPQIIKYLSTLAVYCSRPLCCLVACRCIAIIFNKLKEESSLETRSKYVFSYVSSTLANKPELLKRNSAALLMYATKGLLLRGFTNLNSWLDKILEIIVGESVGDIVADGFRMIVTEDEYFLSPSCHCTIKLFYRQRLFTYLVPKLVELFKSSDPANKNKCAVSALHLLKDVPQSVVDRYFKNIVPLIVELLNINTNCDLTHIALLKVKSMLHENPSFFESYVETFIPKLLLLAREAPEMALRIVALECLQNYAKLNPPAILPFKTKVLFELAPCLDDKKRLVRKQAVKTRTRWFILGVS